MNRAASSLTPVHFPLLILMAYTPVQKPWVGLALKLQGHPQSQLQVATRSPLYFHFVVMPWSFLDIGESPILISAPKIFSYIKTLIPIFSPRFGRGDLSAVPKEVSHAL